MQAAFVEFLESQDLVRDVVATLILVVTVFSVRYVVLRFVRNRLPTIDTQQLRWIAQVRGISYAILAFGLFTIWAAKLQALAVSFVVLAMAVVWATKETIACLQGAVYRLSSNAFQVGDRINLCGIRGDVIDCGLMSTMVLEVGLGHQRTGRLIAIPNSALMTEPVLNESLTGQYILHLMTIPLDRDSDLIAVERTALVAANEACAEFIDGVRGPIETRYRDHGLTPPVVEPRITYQVVDKNTVNLILRIPCPTRLERAVEQRVLRAVLGLQSGRDSLHPLQPY